MRRQLTPLTMPVPLAWQGESCAFTGADQKAASARTARRFRIIGLP